MTRHLDPDRSRPPTFWPFPIDIDTSVCDRCSAMVPATDKAHEQHRSHHRDVDAATAIATWLVSATVLSGSGSNADVTTSDSPDPDPNVPTPEQEVTAGRSGVGDAKNTVQADAAGHPPGGVTAAPAVTPGRPVPLTVAGRMGLPGKRPPAGSLPELGNPARFTR